MDINRNQFFMAGMIVLLLGLQFRVVESFVLSEPVSQFVNERLEGTQSSGSSLLSSSAGFVGGRRTVSPPNWIGWALISVGGVLILHSFAMPRPE